MTPDSRFKRSGTRIFYYQRCSRLQYIFLGESYVKEKNILGKILRFCQNEPVLVTASILAVISSFFIKPDIEYLDYIDFKTLATLFCLMTVMAGFQKTGLFKLMAKKMLNRIQSVRGLSFSLVMLCFFFSMLITNDVALITFVPFTFTVLDMLGASEKKKLLIPIVVMQTVAANLGSMLTPVGNPQNLYLYAASNLSLGEFILLMLPYIAVSFLLLSAWAFCRKETEPIKISFSNQEQISDKKSVVTYFVLFALCLLSVARILDIRITLLILIAAVFVSDYRLFAKADYTLLLTFAAFFIFIGNMGRMPLFADYIRAVIKGHECITGVLASQIISNVPAALLLSGFTTDFKDLIVGVNIGGLGTLIASMASLISFKFAAREDRSLKTKYLMYFTAVNLLFLLILLGVYFARIFI